MFLGPNLSDIIDFGIRFGIAPTAFGLVPDVAENWIDDAAFGSSDFHLEYTCNDSCEDLPPIYPLPSAILEKGFENLSFSISANGKEPCGLELTIIPLGSSELQFTIEILDIQETCLVPTDEAE